MLRGLLRWSGKANRFRWKAPTSRRICYLCSALRLPWADGLLSTRNAAPHPSRDPWLRIVGVSIRRSDGRDRRKDLLDGDPHTIIGIMPPEFSFPQRRAQVWRPLRFRPADLANRNNYLSAIARRKPGVSLEQARQEMRLISARLATQYPKENSALSATVASLRDQVSLQSRTLVMALLAASACVLLIACTNLANLLLARSLPAEGTGRSGFLWERDGSGS